MNNETVSIVRIPAFLIDFILITLVILAANKIMITFGMVKGSFSVEILIFVCIPLTFFAYWITGLNIGKRLLKIEVIDEKTGNKPTIIQNFVRSLLFSLVISLNVVLLIPIFVSKKNRAFHDMLAGTVVVKRELGKGEETV